MNRSRFGLILNKFRYTIYTPIYDLLVKPVFKQQRRASIQDLRIKSGSKILIVGGGTGLDFEFLPSYIKLSASDITGSMVREMKKKAKKLKLQSEIKIMDGQALDYPDAYFDYAILHLIVAVIPDPVACIKEVERVCKVNASVAIFDKFIIPGGKPSLMRRILNIPTSLMFSDITRDIDKIIKETSFKKVYDSPAAFGGNFRIIRLEKMAAESFN